MRTSKKAFWKNHPKASHILSFSLIYCHFTILHADAVNFFILTQVHTYLDSVHIAMISAGVLLFTILNPSDVALIGWIFTAKQR